MKYLPVLSTMNAFFIVKMPHYLEIGAGVVVQALWGILISLIAFLVFRKRYVR